MMILRLKLQDNEKHTHGTIITKGFKIERKLINVVKALIYHRYPYFN